MHPSLIVWRAIQKRYYLLVALDKFQRIVTWRKVCDKLLAVLAHILMQWLDSLLDNRAIANVNVSYIVFAVLVYGNESVQKLLDTITRWRNDWNDWYTNHLTECLVVELCTALLQLVVHTQRNDHLWAYVDKLGREV